MCYYIKNAFFVQKLKKCYISDTLSNFFRIKNVLNHLESFSTCKKLHLETIGMTNFSKWKYWSDSGFPYTMQQCAKWKNTIQILKFLFRKIRSVSNLDIEVISSKAESVLNMVTLVEPWRQNRKLNFFVISKCLMRVKHFSNCTKSFTE